MPFDFQTLIRLSDTWDRYWLTGILWESFHTESLTWSSTFITSKPMHGLKPNAYTCMPFPHFCTLVLAKWTQLPLWYCSLQAFSMCFVQFGFKYLAVAMCKAGFLPLSGKDMSVAYSSQSQYCKELPFNMWIAISYLSLSPRCLKKGKKEEETAYRKQCAQIFVSVIQHTHKNIYRLSCSVIPRDIGDISSGNEVKACAIAMLVSVLWFAHFPSICYLLTVKLLIIISLRQIFFSWMCT